MSYDGWSPYVSVAERRREAARAMEKLRKQGHPVAPVLIEGRTIARTFWGKAWCENLERYSDYANRLPRGRTYVRNGAVLDLQVSAGLVEARVSGSHIYQVRVKVKPVPGPQWQALCKDCGGAIASLVELLQGRFSKGVMERICRQGGGLFPVPEDINLSCSCPDGAYMCKHVAAVLYGIGARLDAQPELLFQLRGVDGSELLTQAASGLAMSTPGPTVDRALEGEDLSELFGLEMGTVPVASTATVTKKAKPRPPLARARKAPAAPKTRAARAGTLKAAPAKAKKAKPPEPRTEKAEAAKPTPAKPRGKVKSKPKPRGGTIA
jgi:uncharacterized Zn finger protein